MAWSEKLWGTAIHEALHATVAVVLCGEITQPVWVSEVARGNNLGEVHARPLFLGTDSMDVAEREMAVRVAPYVHEWSRSRPEHRAEVEARALELAGGDKRKADAIVARVFALARGAMSLAGCWGAVYALAVRLCKDGEVPAAEAEGIILRYWGASPGDAAAPPGPVLPARRARRERPAALILPEPWSRRHSSNRLAMFSPMRAGWGWGPPMGVRPGGIR